MGLFLIPSHKQSFPTQRRSPVKLRMARQHTGRGTLRKPKGRGREAGRDQSCSQAQGLAGRRLSQPWSSRCAPATKHQPTVFSGCQQSCRHQGASLGKWECRYPAASSAWLHLTLLGSSNSLGLPAAVTSHTFSKHECYPEESDKQCLYFSLFTTGRRSLD